jgi:hypothetical protein
MGEGTMGFARIEKFAKTVDCPTTEELLEVQHGHSSQSVLSHLKVCEFCAAEAHMLSRYKPSASSYVPPEMPGNLRLLAESLLMRGKARYLEFD